jgi:hypothetical protein
MVRAAFNGQGAIVMSPDPRDRALETLLRTGANAPQGSADCLDAETLAAWVDDELDSRSRARAEAHMASCAHCQAVMATLVRASDDVTPTGQPDERPARRWWHLNIRWLVPLAGAATAALLWVVVPRPAPQQVTVADEIEPTTPAADTTAVRSEPSESRERESATPAPPAAGALAKEPLAREDHRPARGDRLERKQSRDEPSLMAKAEAPVAQLPEAPAPAPPPPADAEPVLPAPARAASAGIAAEADAVRNRAAFAQVAPVIVSRDSAVRWRVRGDGAIERSGNGGATWATTEASPGVGVLAGASPSPEVCWLVGRAGLVLITIDARTWRRTAAPAVEDLVSVDAVDDRQATVRTPGGVSYRTTDSGATWSRVP